MIDIELREPTEGDWPDIARVANEALPHAADGNVRWLANRRALGDKALARRHYVAVDAGYRIVAYGAVEEDTDGRYRLFAVMDSQRLAGAVGALTYDRLRADLAEFGARAAWMREQADDAPIIAFATARGFHETRRYIYDGVQMVELELPLTTS